MNLYLTAAAILTFLLGLAHTLMGEKLILGPLLKKEQHQIFGSEFLVRRTLRFAWHTTSLFWWGIACVFLVYAGATLSARDILVLRTLSATFFIGSILALIASHGKHFAWYVFLAISILTFWPTLLFP